jgi:hypothetical protein
MPACVSVYRRVYVWVRTRVCALVPIIQLLSNKKAVFRAALCESNFPECHVIV